jgi:hypothetical protein
MKNLLTLITLVCAMAFTTSAVSQDFSGMDKSPMDMASYPTDYKISDKILRVTYGRPQLKGRSLSELAPAGKVWRTGANEAAEITFYKDVTFGGEAVKAGTYSLFTIPGEKEWTIILNNKLNQWGSYFYDASGDVAKVMGGVSEGSESLEAFSIAYKDVDNGIHMIMGWGTTRVAVPITF